MPDWPDNYLPDIAAAQSRLFMCDMLPFIHSALHSFRGSGKVARVLDVGCGCGAGSELLRNLHNPAAYTDLHLQVTAIDSSPRFADWTRSQFPHLDLHIASASGWEEGNKLGELYDLVISSHCIEHNPNPPAFLRSLQAMSAGPVIIACPFLEPDPRHSEHISRIDYDFIRSTKPSHSHFYDSITWQSSPCAVFCYSR